MEGEEVFASITAPDPQGTLCDFFATRGCKNIVPPGAKTRVTDKRTQVSYRLCGDCYRHQTGKLSSVRVSVSHADNPENAAASAQVAHPAGLSARGRQVDTLALRHQVISAQRPDYGRPIPRVVDFPATGHLAPPHNLAGPAVVTPAMRTASDAPVHPSGPYNANHVHLKDDVARWASGKPGSGSSTPNTGYRASVLVSHYAALPRVKHNQRETDIANVYTTIKVHPEASGEEIARSAKNAIIEEWKRRGCSFSWKMTDADVRDPRNHANVEHEKAGGYFKAQLLIIPTGKSAKGKRAEYKDPAKQLSIRVVSKAEEHERYQAYMENLGTESDGESMTAIQPHPTKPVLSKSQQKRPAPTNPMSSSARPGASALAGPSKRPRTQSKPFIMPTFTNLEASASLQITKRPPTPTLSGSDGDLPTIGEIIKAPTTDPKKMPPSNATGSNPSKAPSLNPTKSVNPGPIPAGPHPRMAISGLVSDPTAIRSAPQPFPGSSLAARTSPSVLDATAFKRALEAGGAGTMTSRKLIGFQDVVEQATIHTISRVSLDALIDDAGGPTSLIDLFHQARETRPLETADICVSLRQFRRGSFKTSHETKHLAMRGPGPWPPGHISQFKVVAKRMYRRTKEGALERLPVERELAGLLTEGNLLMWSDSMHTECDARVEAKVRESGSPPFPLPKLRFVTAAIATVVGKAERERGIFVPAMTGSYLLEERIEGRFVKYINNCDCQPADNLSPNDGVYYENALYLCFSQHLQYNMTEGLAYVSDYQGNDKVLTDTQIITNPKRFKTRLFGDGNITSAFASFPLKHECNKFCQWYGLAPFSKT